MKITFLNELESIELIESIRNQQFKKITKNTPEDWISSTTTEMSLNFL